MLLASTRSRPFILTKEIQLMLDIYMLNYLPRNGKNVIVFIKNFTFVLKSDTITILKYTI